MEPQMGAQRRTHFSRLASFFVLGGLGSQNDPKASPKSPQDQSRHRCSSILRRFFDGLVDDILYHVAKLLSSLPLFCYLEPYFSNFGVVRGVICELRSAARWREGRRQVDKTKTLIPRAPKRTPRVPNWKTMVRPGKKEQEDRRVPFPTLLS